MDVQKRKGELVEAVYKDESKEKVMRLYQLQSSKLRQQNLQLSNPLKDCCFAFWV